MMTRVLLPALLLLSMNAGAQPAARPDIAAMLEATGAIEALDRMFTPETIEAQMRGMLRPETAPPEQRAKAERFVKEFAAEFAAEVKQHRQTLLDQTIAVYAKHYTPEDVKAILAFYQTPVGKKMAKSASALAMESMQTAQKWGQELGQQVGQRVSQRLESEAPQKK